MAALPVVGTLGLLLVPLLASAANTSPHVVIILADDLGWNDVSYHGSDQYQTPNIDALAYSGVILQNYYTQPICTPSRAALLTGMHPIHNGMEHGVINAPEPWGLPLSERLLPQYLQDVGYTTRAVGKWHLGFFRANYTPTLRGFHSHYGCWLGHQNHFTHMGYDADPGYDLHRGLDFAWEAKGKYNTDLFTEEAESIIQSHDVNRPLFLYLAHTATHAPLQAPQQVIDQFSHIKTLKRRTFAAMVKKLDESVGRVVEALKKKNMLENSIILFLSDNGGATHGYDGNVASNWPLRGGKNTLWEGGVRGVGLVWSPLLKSTPRVHEGLVNVQDWVPTILSATGNSNSAGTLDGVSQWSALNKEASAPYEEVLLNIDPKGKKGAIRSGKWKLIYGKQYNGKFNGIYGILKGKVAYDQEAIRNSTAGRAVRATINNLPSDSDMLALRKSATVSCSSTAATTCKPQQAPCLFDVTSDPCETTDLASQYPEVVEQLQAKITAYTVVTPNNLGKDPRSLPSNWNNTWTTWMDFL